MAPGYESPPGRAQRPAVEVEVALVAAEQPQRGVCKQSICSPRSSSAGYRLDDAVEHWDKGGAFRMKSLRHLRETDPARM